MELNFYSPSMPSWRGQGPIYVYTFVIIHCRYLRLVKGGLLSCTVVLKAKVNVLPAFNQTSLRERYEEWMYISKHSLPRRWIEVKHDFTTRKQV